MLYQQLSLVCMTILSIASAAKLPRANRYHDHYRLPVGHSWGSPQQSSTSVSVASVSVTPGQDSPGESTSSGSESGSLTGGSISGSTGGSGGNTQSPDTSGASVSNETTAINSTSNSGGASGGIRKGAGVWAVSGLGDMVTKIGAAWAYDWSDHPENSFTYQSSIPANVELVAMVNLTSDLAALASSSYKEIIGYNEPDRQAASIDSSTAANHWPAVVATGKRIGSPAPASTSLKQGDWFFDFMSSITQAGSHVDFVCLHFYSPYGNVDDFRSYVEGVYNMYKLPIWITEWAYVDYSKDPPYTPDENSQVTYMKAAVGMLEILGYVERYAWFAVPQSDAQPASNLFDASGNITSMGTAYSAL